MRVMRKSFEIGIGKNEKNINHKYTFVTDGILEMSIRSSFAK